MNLMQEGELVAVVGGSGGTNIIAAVIQVFLNCFVMKMKPLEAVASARVYHKVTKTVIMMMFARPAGWVSLGYLVL